MTKSYSLKDEVYNINIAAALTLTAQGRLGTYPVCYFDSLLHERHFSQCTTSVYMIVISKLLDVIQNHIKLCYKKKTPRYISTYRIDSGFGFLSGFASFFFPLTKESSGFRKGPNKDFILICSGYCFQ